MQLPATHPALHSDVPVEPQLVAHAFVEPAQHAKPLSQPLTQSSSRPLQISGGGAQAPHMHVALHAREPVELQLVVQLPIDD